MKEVIIYTDGACKGNPGPGGWAALLMYKDKKREIYGAEPHTTNQRMELQAAIEGLRLLKEPCQVRLHSDSAYLVNAFRQRWLERWEKNGWRTRNKQPVENQDLWRELLGLATYHRVEWNKVRGHSTDEYNNRCDYLAQEAALGNLP
ncbi:MAG TPA: ribonuclease HI [Firmicutes bacterium]|jgi:ribonuclease HI|nr:ribonuclease HI [Bacillota bacterium]